MATAVRTHVDVEEKSSPATTAISHLSNSMTYRAGDPVPNPGTYWVCHHKHRPVHASKVRFTLFPPCAQCGNRVRFHPAAPEKSRVTEWLRRDPDFKHALKPVRRRRRKTTMPQ